MPAVSLEDNGPVPEGNGQGDKTLSGPIIGIIYPPPEVRSILNLKQTAATALIEWQQKTFTNV